MKIHTWDIFYYYLSKYSYTHNMLTAKILFDEAADKCLCMIGRLWSERGWSEEISRCLCSKWLAVVHLTDWWQSPLTTHHQHAKINKGTKFLRTYSKVYQEVSAKTAETTERWHIHGFSVICSPLFFAPLKHMTENTDAYVNISTASLTHSPTLLFLLHVINH